MVNTVTAEELKALKDGQEDFQLIDVRETHEFEAGNIDGLHIPLSEIPSRLDEIETGKKVVIHCKGGTRSEMACMLLKSQKPEVHAYNLVGGIKAYRDSIDPSITVF